MTFLWPHFLWLLALLPLLVVCLLVLEVLDAASVTPGSASAIPTVSI